MDFERPILKITASGSDILLERLSILGLVLIWILVITQYSSLPDTIPIHFNAKGDVDNYGSKATLFLLPTIISIVIIGLTILNRYPHIFNYLQKITAENALKEYSSATRLLRIIKLIIVIFSLVIIFDITRSAKAGHSTLNWWIIPLFIISMISPVIISIYQSAKKNNQG